MRKLISEVHVISWKDHSRHGLLCGSELGHLLRENLTLFMQSIKP
jgi:hypothetical protein